VLEEVGSPEVVLGADTLQIISVSGNVIASDCKITNYWACSE
jgi:hypothetical protein